MSTDVSRILWQQQPLMPTPSTPSTPPASKPTSFANVLHREQNRVSFSQHAMQRLQTRNLGLTAQDLAKLDDAVAKMADKGAREALVYMNDVALIVSVANKTVITALDGNSAKDNIFTNIDSAAIL